ncbi:IS30 family transposase [Proteocatella sphenisci]|uniref:IS30 family transposase n=2 Tax=Proteocatella sphenisci TaxID=181070 RepID=UPI00048A677D|nr:IS30 family transposase [Proteocatella sphenisci]
MDYTNYNTDFRKHKHLNDFERHSIQIRLTEGWSPYKIAKSLDRAQNTILNEIRKGTVSQLKHGKKIELYFSDAGKSIYEKNRRNCGPKFRRLICSDFIDYVCEKIKNDSWSVDACVGEAKLNSKFHRSKMVCTKTLYNYIDLGLLTLKNIDLPMKLRLSTKKKRVRANKRNLGRSISERPEHIANREEFGHWEIDTVIGSKTNDDDVLLTIAERKTRKFIIFKIPSKTSTSVNSGIHNIKLMFGEKFNDVFKTITSDNGQEFSALSNLEENNGPKIYFTHPYSSFERGTNERHNGLIRRFIQKGERIDSFSTNYIEFIEDWSNSLPRKILGYKSPDELFEDHLDIIYAV